MLQIKNLKFRYQNQSSNSKFELDIPDWMIEKRDFVSLLGPNGCGKSTLLRLMAGLTHPQNGSIEVSGMNISSLTRKDLSQKIAYVPQKSSSVFPFSVYEIVMMGRTPYLNFMGFESTNDQKIVNEVLDMMQVNHLKTKGINEISGGEAQRVFIARALAQNADIILLDEPNTHLDIEHQIMIFDILKKLNQEKGITIITVSHDLNLVGIYAEKVAFMVEGKVISQGMKSDLLNESNIKEIFKVNTKIYSAENSSQMNILINPMCS